MSEFSEKDIITYLKNSLNDEFNFKNCTRIQDKMAIQGLLDLYEKEKGKNKRYLKYLENKDKHYESVLEYLESEKEQEYISKDKIREKIEGLRKIHEDRDFTNKESYYLDCYKELLEERN